jgi:hypothetical protein
LIAPVRDKVIVDDVAVAVLRGGCELAEGFAVYVKLSNVPEPELVIGLRLINFLN